MTSVHALYTKEIYSNLKYRPTWLPGTPIKLGTVGVMKEHIFHAITDLGNMGVRFSTVSDTKQGAVRFASEGAASITFKAAGEAAQGFKAVAQADAGALIELSREGAVVLQLQDVLVERISDQMELSRTILRSLAGGDSRKRWKREWVVVSEVVKAGAATIVISSAAESRLELKASGTLSPTSLVDVSAGFSMAAESKVSTNIIAQAGLTPLFRGLRVKPKFLWMFADVVPASAAGADHGDVLGDADPTEDHEFD